MRAAAIASKHVASTVPASSVSMQKEEANAEANAPAQSGFDETFHLCFGFALVHGARGEADKSADILSLSMPANAKYPLAFCQLIHELPPQTLTTIVKTPKKAFQSFLDGTRKLNRKKWQQLVRAGKADAILNLKSDRCAESKAAAAVAKTVRLARRAWLHEQLVYVATY
jgi:hypothetical protein